mmetsp:Transcript_4874/g.14017  ORF Transcript_4874/g.14017 Transcript_4874/m.14017 type:complete len:241 (+) Transcript_4874:66-788(+)
MSGRGSMVAAAAAMACCSMTKGRRMLAPRRRKARQMAAADHTRMPALLTGIDAPTAETTLTATSIATATATAVAAMGDVGMRTAEMSQSGARVEMWPGMSVDEKGGMIGMEIGPETGAATVEGTEGTQTGSGTLYGTPAAHVTRLGASGENWGGNVTTGPESTAEGRLAGSERTGGGIGKQMWMPVVMVVWGTGRSKRSKSTTTERSVMAAAARNTSTAAMTDDAAVRVSARCASGIVRK